MRGDEFISEDGENWDASWDPFWMSKAKQDSLGYTVEARIPFSQLRFGSDASQEWGLQVNRNIFRRQEGDSWASVKQAQPGWVSRFGTLKGLEGLKPRKPLEVQPYVLGQVRTGEDRAAGDPYAGRQDLRASVGLDGRIGITNDVAVDFTINPDFGQVEADPGAINLDGFQIFFREQRPFFVENRNIFDYDVSQSIAGGSFGSDILFYSRRIGGSPSRFVGDDPANLRYVFQPENTTILGAAKVSGKTAGGLSIGALSSATQRERASVTEGGAERRELVEPFTLYHVARLQQDFNERQSSIGGMVTAVHRDIDDPALAFLHDDAYTGGLDLVHRWRDRAWQARVNLVASRVSGDTLAILATQTAFEHLYQRPDARHVRVDSARTSLMGAGGTATVGYLEGDWTFEAGATFRTPGLDLNDIGFMTEADRVDAFVWGARRWQNPVGPFNRAQWNHNFYAGWDFSGQSTYRRYNTNANAQLKTFQNLNVYLNLEQQDITKTALRGGPRLRRAPGFYTGGYASTDSRKDVVFGAFVGFGGAYERDLNRGYNVGADIQTQPLDALQIYLGPSFDQTRRQDQYFRTVGQGAEARYLHGTIEQQTFSLTLRATYNLTPDFTLQYYGQPFVARGVYSEFKEVAAPLARDFDERFLTYAPRDVRFDEDAGRYTVSGESTGGEAVRFGNPDFNFLQFRSNFVARWEYRPSSTVFFVWSQGVEGAGMPARGVFESLGGDLFGEGVRNTFLVKGTYRFVR